eukprot:TRINITY_DN45223_c0_g1_i1.p2 TRINITY_DN45223_c0_g1~~TRINITY_DN45223_c0_g1_i1.p2  ORF type:complete len:186 (-),score=37.73 TRINITY_DN45223_c0_g1_i1:11-568(-)
MLAMPEGYASSFECWWEPASGVKSENLEAEALASIVSPSALAPLLALVSSESDQRIAAYRFAELLKLPAYRWISSRLAQLYTEDMLALGGSKLGTKPVIREESIRMPPRMTLTLANRSLSAREAYELILSRAALADPGWRPVSVFSTLIDIAHDGRSKELGVWAVEIGRAVQQECRDRSRMPSSA